jgi:hypothetical protein
LIRTPLSHVGSDALPWNVDFRLSDDRLLVPSQRASPVKFDLLAWQTW